FKNMNESAVSPIVATLVLIVVAVVGAVAVGTIIGAFSSDVSEQVNPGDVAGASSAEILIAGSTTVQPASELLAKAYMAEKPGVKISVQGGGSGAGVTSVGMDIVDIGSASRPVKDTELAKYPSLQTYQIGGSGVAIVVPDGAKDKITGVTKAGLTDLYDNTTEQNSATVGWTDAPPTNKIIDANEIGEATETTVNITVYQRAEASGTEETVAKEYLKYPGDSFDNTGAEGVNGNAGVAAAIAAGSATNVRLGFIDFGYVTSAHKALDVDGKVCDKMHILESLKGVDDTETTSYVEKLARPLNYIVNGNPSAIVKDYINFAQSPGAVDSIHDVGMFSIVEFA
ncbi:MAG: Phosphate ABC transporter, solute-binding protein, partial [Methanoculleus marisnigri]